MWETIRYQNDIYTCTYLKRYIYFFLHISKIIWYQSRWGRVGSGQGNPSILTLLVLSQADISESTQNHFELI